MVPAIFLDKDGTLIKDIPYNVDPRRIQFMPGTKEGLQLLHVAGYKFVIITNQPGVAAGYFSEKALYVVEIFMRQQMSEFGVPLAGFFYCPHLPGGMPDYDMECSCRKPKPGLILKAIRELGIDVMRSWFIGDILNDIEAGRRAGCKTILIDNGNETEWILSSYRLPHYTVKNFLEAVRIITRRVIV
ncbi:MAG: HAD family hydrolase [wastewater metagenome]|nr:HAD family hydrolase [Candidatus Loosdrechtia aerotolerans]